MPLEDPRTGGASLCFCPFEALDTHSSGLDSAGICMDAATARSPLSLLPPTPAPVTQRGSLSPSLHRHISTLTAEHSCFGRSAADALATLVLDVDDSTIGDADEESATVPLHNDAFVRHVSPNQPLNHPHEQTSQVHQFNPPACDGKSQATVLPGSSSGEFSFSRLTSPTALTVKLQERRARFRQCAPVHAQPSHVTPEEWDPPCDLSDRRDGGTDDVSRAESSGHRLPTTTHASAEFAFSTCDETCAEADRVLIAAMIDTTRAIASPLIGLHSVASQNSEEAPLSLGSYRYLTDEATGASTSSGHHVPVIGMGPASFWNLPEYSQDREDQPIDRTPETTRDRSAQTRALSEGHTSHSSVVTLSYRDDIDRTVTEIMLRFVDHSPIPAGDGLP